MSEWILKQIRDYYLRATSTNARLEVNVTCQSRVVRLPGDILRLSKLDVKTAKLDMSFTVRILKLLTPEELSLATQVVAVGIKNGKEISASYK